MAVNIHRNSFTIRPSTDDAAQSAIDGRSEDVSDPAGLLSKQVGVDPEGDRRVGVTEASSDHMHGYIGGALVAALTRRVQERHTSEDSARCSPRGSARTSRQRCRGLARRPARGPLRRARPLHLRTEVPEGHPYSQFLQRDLDWSAPKGWPASSRTPSDSNRFMTGVARP